MKKQGKKKLHLQIRDASIITTILSGIGAGISYKICDTDLFLFIVSFMTVGLSTTTLLCASAYGDMKKEQKNLEEQLENLKEIKKELEAKKENSFQRFIPAYTKEDNIIKVDFQEIQSVKEKERKLKYKK